VTNTVTRQSLFIVTTPYEAAAEVVCYVDTYQYHLQLERQLPEMRQIAENSLEAPQAVVAGTSNPDYVAFVNQDVTSPGSGNPFVVFVDPKAQPMAAVASWGYRRDFKDLSRHTVLWLPPPKK